MDEYEDDFEKFEKSAEDSVGATEQTDGSTQSVEDAKNDLKPTRIPKLKVALAERLGIEDEENRKLKSELERSRRELAAALEDLAQANRTIDVLAGSDADNAPGTAGSGPRLPFISARPDTISSVQHEPGFPTPRPGKRIKGSGSARRRPLYASGCAVHEKELANSMKQLSLARTEIKSLRRQLDTSPFERIAALENVTKDQERLITALKQEIHTLKQFQRQLDPSTSSEAKAAARAVELEEELRTVKVS